MKPRYLLLCLLAACDDAAGGAYGGDPAWAPLPSLPPAGNTENYENYGTNPFVDPGDDRLVTFAVDVDTGSYTLMRAGLTDGYLPAPDGVRVEEYINFFDYRDAPPADDRPLAIHLEAAPSPFGPALHLLRVALKGQVLEAVERPAANLVFLVDVSGSMASPDKLPLVKYALRRLTETLQPTDTIGLVTYAGEAGVVLEPTPVRDRATILAAIERLDAGGGTYGEGGIRAAYALAEAARRPGAISRVLLCSDGDFNVGLTGDALIDLIETAREGGVTLSVFGFGRGNYNDRDMEQLADHGNGQYAYIDREGEAERLLVQDLTSTLVVIAQDVKVQVELNPDLVRRYRLLGYENRDIADEDFRNDRVDAGEIGAGHAVTAFIELELAPGARESQAALATVNVRWKDPQFVETTGETVRALAGAEVLADLDRASAAFRFGAAVSEFAEILRGSEHSVGRRFAEVIALAEGAAHPDEPDQAELIELVGRAARLMGAE